jgi:hypothetical protein
LEVASGSAITRLNSIETVTGSNITRLSSLEAKTGSYATTGSNTFDGGQYLSSSFNPTGFSTTASLYTDGGLRVTRDAYISGTLYLNNVTVFGTQSVAYISSSQLNIGTNLITVNTDTPSIRFGGLAVYDSGSTGLTGSLPWDSQNNHWVYSNPSGSSYSGGMFISGPRTSTLGSETGTTSCMLLAGQGGDHLTSSIIYHSSTVTCIPNTLIGSTVCGSISTFSSTSTACNFVTSGNTLFGITLKGRASDNFGAIGFYSSDGGTRYGYLQSHSTNCGQLIVNGDGGGQAIFDCRGVVLTSVMSGTRGTFTSCLGVGHSPNGYVLDVCGTQRTIGSLTINEDGGGTKVLTVRSDWAGVDPAINVTTNNCLLLMTNNTVRVCLSNTGIATFACQICAPTLNLNSSGTGTLTLGTTDGPRIAGRITASPSPSYSSTGKLGFSITTWGANTDYGLTEVMAIDMRNPDNKNPVIWMNPFGGNVGIGTTVPNTNLEIMVNNTSAPAITKIRLAGQGNGAYGGEQFIDFAYNDYGNLGYTYKTAFIKSISSTPTGNNASGTLVFATKNLASAYNSEPTERMRISSDGVMSQTQPLGKNFIILKSITIDPSSTGFASINLADYMSPTFHINMNITAGAYGNSADGAGIFKIAYGGYYGEVAGNFSAILANCITNGVWGWCRNNTSYCVALQNTGTQSKFVMVKFDVSYQS